MERNKEIKKRTIVHLSKQIILKNKVKFVSILLAIILTTILFTILYTISNSMKLSDEKNTMRKIGNSGDASFKDLTKEQAETLKQYSEIAQYNSQIFIGVAKNDELLGRSTEIWYLQEGESRLDFAVPTVGNMPAKSNEIACDTIILDRLQLPHEIGSIIELKWKKSPVAEEVLTESFVLTGFWEGDNLSSASKIWVSEEFVQSNFVDEELDWNYKLDVLFHDQKNLEEKTEKMIVDSGYDAEEILFGISWSVEENTRTQIIFYGFCILLIVLCGYLIISNTIRITLQNDIMLYAKLKMLGLTGKQVNQIIFYQIRLISYIAIPAGVGIGFLISYFLLPNLLYYYEGGYVLSTNPFIFLIAAVFAMVTVVISCKKPLHIIAKISPIKSDQYFLTTLKKKKEMKKITIGKLVKRYFSKDNKERILTMFSLTLGLVLINSIYTIQYSFDASKYLSDQVIGDFILSPTSLYHGFYNMEDGKVLENVSSDIQSIDGIEEIGEIYYRETIIEMNESTKKMTIDFYSIPEVYGAMSTDEDWLREFEEMQKSSNMFAKIFGMDQSVLEKLNIYKGEWDAEKFQTGDYVLECGLAGNGDMHDNDKIGDKILLEGKEYTVMGYIDLLALERRNRTKEETAITKSYVIPSSKFYEQYPNDSLFQLIVDAEEGELSNVQEKLEGYQSDKKHKLMITSKQTYLNAYEMEIGATTIMWRTLSFLIALIGFVNFINIRLSSGFARKKEFLLMGKIGMTGKQLRSMLNIEGIVLILGTGLLSMVLSSVLSLTFIRDYVSEGWTNTYHFMLIPVVVIVVVLLLMNYIVCRYVYRRTLRGI